MRALEFNIDFVNFLLSNYASFWVTDVPNQLQDEGGDGQSSNNARHAARAAHEKLINKQSDALSALNALLAYEKASNKAAFCRYASCAFDFIPTFGGWTVLPIANIIGDQTGRST